MFHVKQTPMPIGNYTRNYDNNFSQQSFSAARKFAQITKIGAPVLSVGSIHGMERALGLFVPLENVFMSHLRAPFLMKKSCILARLFRLLLC